MSNTTITPSVGASTLAGIAIAGFALGIRPGAVDTYLSGTTPNTYPVRPSLNAGHNSGTWTYQWTGLINGTSGLHTGTVSTIKGYSGASAQISGTFGTSGSAQLEGSMDGVQWVNLSPGAKTTAALVYLAPDEQPTYLRPRVTAGDSTTNLSVILKLSGVR